MSGGNHDQRSGIVAAIIVAAGRGSRMGAAGSAPKQYATVGGRAVLDIARHAFADHDGIDLVLPVIHPDDLSLFEAAVREWDVLSLTHHRVHLFDAPMWHPEARMRAQLLEIMARPNCYAENRPASMGKVGLSTTIKADDWDDGGVKVRDEYMTWEAFNKESPLPIVHDPALAERLLNRYRGGIDPDPKTGPVNWVIHWSKINRIGK